MRAYIIINEIDASEPRRVCVDNLRVIRNYGAVIIVVALALVHIVAHTGVKDVVDSSVNQLLNMTVNELCGVADCV